MEKLIAEDFLLIEQAQKAIARNYNPKREQHIVGAALKTKAGKIYTGINVNAIHGACAEVIALGAALTAGEREFSCIVAVRGKEGEEVVSPCGNCRQILSEYCPGCQVILPVAGELYRLELGEALPYCYLELPSK